jgi:hypothetical protein
LSFGAGAPLNIEPTADANPRQSPMAATPATTLITTGEVFFLNLLPQNLQFLAATEFL